jgi:hypothetical protein
LIKKLPQKKEVKTPAKRKVIGCDFAFMQRLGFYAIAHEEQIFYVVSQEVNKHIFTVLHCELASNVLYIKR